MVDRLGMHRLDKTEVVCNARRIRQQFADPCTALSVLGKTIFGAGKGQ